MEELQMILQTVVASLCQPRFVELYGSGSRSMCLVFVFLAFFLTMCNFTVLAFVSNQCCPQFTAN